jgi:hypothetical protein
VRNIGYLEDHQTSSGLTAGLASSLFPEQST